MAGLPERFRAYVVDAGEGRPFERGLRDRTPADLPPGEVTIRVDWSGVNFKDGLAAREDGKVARGYPRVPGIDLAGEVIASEAADLPVGTRVVAHGYELGTSRDGGYSEVQRVPAAWVVPRPDGLTAREAMAIGTAGYTAGMGVATLEARGLRPGDGPVIVTGASGGVGTIAVGILTARGHEVWATTGKDEERERLSALGVAGFVSRDEVTAPGRPLD
jgi:acrylyl-CoA reductase (NADPH)